jgi:hypothetical protein
VKKLIPGIIALFLISITASAAQKIPEGWRIPLEDEFPDNQYMYRLKDPDRYLAASADFNGDGIVDTARFVLNDSTKEMGLLVFISKENTFETVFLDKRESIGMGLSVVKPGKYKTACGKGYWKCKEGEPELVELKHPAINYFQFEGASSFFIWDESAKSFKRVWISD